ncbi:MAG: DUF167 domain-containing protein [Vicinamibacteraceae bacterium]|nr:DUF167 domain-containing protein [Vicinamibacteraceae bacterium]
MLDVPGGVDLLVRVIPRAAKTQLAGEREGALLVRLNAPPVEGAANAALVAFLAATLDVPRRAVTIAAGERARGKRVHVAGLQPREAVRRLGGRDSSA